MDKVLCDELLLEIFNKLPSSYSSSVSLVSKRWLHLYRSSRTSLSLRLTPNFSAFPSLSSFLSHHPSLSFLSLFSSYPSSAALTDHLLSIVFCNCSQLHGLKYLGGPISPSSLFSLSTTSPQLVSLFINLSRPICLRWVLSFPLLKELSINFTSEYCLENETKFNSEYGLRENEDFDGELELESLCLLGIKADDWGLGWLWRSCRKLKKLQLKNCQGIGDGGSFSSFVKLLKGLQKIELRTCRSIVDGVLLRLAENCVSLNSLLVYDGGSREGLLHFFTNCRSNLQELDLRLPLDLDNNNLSAIALNLRSLSILRLQSCCLVTGEGLKALGSAMVGHVLEELGLINCDLIEREPGLLATLGQHFRKLKKLDLSYNEMLLDKELISMLVSCNYLIDLRLRGCKGLTNMTMVAMIRSCKFLESVDLLHCCRIECEAIEMFLRNCPNLKRMDVEESKLSDAAKMVASLKFIEVGV